jgi:hypothetical protein
MAHNAGGFRRVLSSPAWETKDENLELDRELLDKKGSIVARFSYDATVQFGTVKTFPSNSRPIPREIIDIDAIRIVPKPVKAYRC